MISVDVHRESRKSYQAGSQRFLDLSRSSCIQGSEHARSNIQLLLHDLGSSALALKLNFQNGGIPDTYTVGEVTSAVLSFGPFSRTDVQGSYFFHARRL